MINESFSIWEAYKYGWQQLRAHFWLFMLLTLIPALADLGEVEKSIDLATSSAFAVLSLVVILALIVSSLYYVVTDVSLQIQSGEDVTLKNRRVSISRIAAFTVLFIVYYLATVGGLVALIIPGVIIAVRFGVAPYVFIDRAAGVLESFKISKKLTKGHFWNLLFFSVSTFVVLGVGDLSFFGQFITFPVVVMASVYIYKELERLYVANKTEIA